MPAIKLWKSTNCIVPLTFNKFSEKLQQLPISTLVLTCFKGCVQQRLEWTFNAYRLEHYSNKVWRLPWWCGNPTFEPRACRLKRTRKGKWPPKWHKRTLSWAMTSCDFGQLSWVSELWEVALKEAWCWHNARTYQHLLGILVQEKHGQEAFSLRLTL